MVITQTQNRKMPRATSGKVTIRENCPGEPRAKESEWPAPGKPCEALHVPRCMQNPVKQPPRGAWEQPGLNLGWGCGHWLTLTVYGSKVMVIMQTW